MKKAPITIIFLTLNIIIFALQYFGGENMIRPHLLALHYGKGFERYQLISHMFVHRNFIHLMLNMLNMLVLGITVEQFMGSKRFFCYYLLCGLGALLCQCFIVFGHIYLDLLQIQPGLLIGDFLQGLFSHTIGTLRGASGAIYGILFAFIWISEKDKNRLKVMIVIIAIDFFFFLLLKISESLFSYTLGWNIAHGAHLGGLMTGFLLRKFYYKQKAIQVKK